MLAVLGRAAALCLGYPLAIIGSCLVVFVPRLRTVCNGSDPNASSTRYAVYVTYDRRSLVADYVVCQVEALARLGYRVAVISNSRRLPANEAAKLLQHSWRVLHRRNFGHDFGAYKDGIRQIGPMEGVESLILMNDSCYGPLYNLDSVEQRAQASSADIWAITDSWSTKYHLQSYFLRIGRRALRSRAFGIFWATLLPYQSRALTIRLGEIRFTQHMVRRGMVTSVLCPYQEVARRALQLILTRISGNPGHLLSAEKGYLEWLANQVSKGATLNSMHSFWDVLVVEFACPFIKGNLLRRNPACIPGLIEWTSLLSNHTDYDIGLIHRHLKIG
jgi:lipopolysaccharide biosynthesis protein